MSCLSISKALKALNNITLVTPRTILYQKKGPTLKPVEKTYFHYAQDLDHYAQKALLKPDTRLDNAVTNSKAHGLPPIAVPPLPGKLISLQCRLIGAKTVLEVGTLGGYSAIWLAESGAHVTSIELNPRHREVALENTKGLGAALDVLPNLAEQGRKFDFVFLDASWDEQWECFDWAVKLTRPGGCVHVDNVIREMLESDLVGEGKEFLVTKVGRDERVDDTLVPTVGSHKKSDEMFDGFLKAVVKG